MKSQILAADFDGAATHETAASSFQNRSLEVAEELHAVGLRWRFYERLEEAAIAAGLSGSDELAEMWLADKLVKPGGYTSLAADLMTGRALTAEQRKDIGDRVAELSAVWTARDAQAPETVPLEGFPEDPPARHVMPLSLSAPVVEKLLESARITGVSASSMAGTFIAASFENEVGGQFVPVMVPVEALRAAMLEPLNAGGEA